MSESRIAWENEVAYWKNLCAATDAQLTTQRQETERVAKELAEVKGDVELLDWFEAEANKGYAPSLIYDDNGNWAVAQNTNQNVRMSDADDLEICHYIEAKKFKPTVRAAIKAARRDE